MINFEQVIMMLGGYQHFDSTSIAQRASKVIVKYIATLDQNYRPLLEQAKDQLVQVLLTQVNESRDKNKTVYVRFLEIAVELALVSEFICNEIAKPVIS